MTGICVRPARIRWCVCFFNWPSSSLKKLKQLGFREVSWDNCDERERGRDAGLQGGSFKTRSAAWVPSLGY